MANPTTQVLFGVIILVLALLSSPIFSKEIEDEKEFDYDKGSDEGPEKWGDLHPEWSMCKNGKMQSPIDLLDEKVFVGSHLGELHSSYKPTDAKIRISDHDIELSWEEIGGDAGSIQINDTQYVLKQCHWHSPSEHTINGNRFDLELQLLHESSDNQKAVVAIVYKIGQPDAFLSKLMGHIKSLTDTDEEEKVVGVVDPNHIEIGSRNYYRYMGSLTTPPCSESVVWTIVQKVGTVSKEQVRLLRAAIDDDSNARPLQPINNRPIYLYQPKDHLGN